MIVGEGLCSNIYVIGKDRATVIDTGVGNRANPIWPQLEEIGIGPGNLRNIIITHAHHDHASGTFILLDRSDPKVFIHSRDTKYIATHFGNALVKVEEGDVIETELWPLQVIWTPGHTEGGMCLYAKDQGILFSGDTVFSDGYFGRSDGESGDHQTLIHSIKKLTKLNVNIMLAGHGTPVLAGASENIKLALRNAELYG